MASWLPSSGLKAFRLFSWFRPAVVSGLRLFPHSVRFFASGSSSAWKSPYEILNVDQKASDEVIKDAYRKLAKQFHPDVNKSPQAAEKFKEINSAYQDLSDPEKRQMVDARLSGESFDESMFAHFHGGTGSGGGSSDGFSSVFDDILFGDRDFFGMKRGRGQQARSSMAPQTGEHISAVLALNFMEAVHGCKKNITLTKRDVCKPCGGLGAASPDSIRVCPTCSGQGMTSMRRGFFQVSQTCRRCGGEGKVMKDPCKTCAGSGTTTVKTEETINVSPGVYSGVVLRLRGGGHAGTRGGPPGDLVVEFQVEDDPFFIRKGFDVHSSVSVSLKEALLGGKIAIPTVDGVEDIRIPGGIQPGDVRKMSGKGIHHLNGVGYGDHILTFQVILPKKLTERQKELIAEFSNIEGSSSHGTTSHAEHNKILRQAIEKVKNYWKERSKKKSPISHDGKDGARRS